jgi:hypothetical protein
MIRKKKIMNKYFIIFIIVTILIINLTIFYFNNKKEIDYINTGKKIESKVFYSPQKKHAITVLLFTTAIVDYESYIYVFDKEYKNSVIPKSNNYIMFPDGTGIYIEWEKEDYCTITCDNYPRFNKLTVLGYKLDLVIDKDKIDSLRTSGKVIRYSLNTVISEK